WQQHSKWPQLTF
nr:immunoglobulin light chain junction region [Macaca mulatta]MPN96474.1 immunoglobulin light chain junction region [Macaca mulatta]MPN97107.1 immunoglobulin light chain junction region [Macaca mulatta]MPN99420.1 immunoglobulin light chain junction region [Macaca mulatta]MPO00128.1 immunoglobulin light chain junction region [Macaca mulatta]